MSAVIFLLLLRIHFSLRWRCRLLVCRPRRGSVACSPYGTQDHLLESRFRAVQFYDDPTNDCAKRSPENLTAAHSPLVEPLLDNLDKELWHHSTQLVPQYSTQLGGLSDRIPNRTKNRPPHPPRSCRHQLCVPLHTQTIDHTMRCSKQKARPNTPPPSSLNTLPQIPLLFFNTSPPPQPTFFLVQTKMSWRSPLTSRTSRNQGSQLSSATMIPQLPGWAEKD